MKGKNERIGKRTDGVRRRRNGEKEEEGEKMDQKCKDISRMRKKMCIEGRRKEL